MTQVESKIILVQEHFVQLENVMFPESFLELWKNTHYFLNTRLLDSHCCDHCVCSCRTMINIGNNGVESKNLPLIVRLLKDSAFVNEFNLATSLCDEVNVFGDFSTL